MARIRSFKPELWTDSTVVALSPLARLLWIGSWSFADDYGCMPADALQLKLRVLPAESCDPEPLIAELLQAEVLEERFSEAGERFWHITNWEKHQKVEKRAQPLFGFPETWRTLPEISPTIPEPSPTLPQPLPSGLEGMGEEGNGLEGSGIFSAPTARAPNHVWLAFSDLFGEPTNDKAEKRRGANVNPVIDSIANTTGQSRTEVRTNPQSYDFVAQRASAWPLHFDTATITEEALMKHWETLGRPPMRATNGQVKKLAREIQSRFRRQELKAMEL